MSAPVSSGFRFAIDRGGTFTDVYAELPDDVGGGHVVMKLLSESPAYPDAPREGIRRVLRAHPPPGAAAPAEDAMCGAAAAAAAGVRWARR